MAVLEYATIFSNVLRELYGQALTCDDLYHSNSDIQIINGKDIKIPKLSVSGYKDHTRGAGGFNSGIYSNGYETKNLDHDRDIEFAIDPIDVDETNMVVTIANIQTRFEKTQAIPELDCYTYSKLYTEALEASWCNSKNYCINCGECACQILTITLRLLPKQVYRSTGLFFMRHHSTKSF